MGAGSALIRIILTFAAVGCGCTPPDAGLRLLVDIDEGIEVPEMLDELRVEVTASSSTGRFCYPVTLFFPLDDETHLPLSIALRRGEEYAAQVAYHLRGFSDGELTHVGHGASESWPEDGVREVSVLLEGQCLQAEVSCLDSEQCFGGECREIEYAPLFRDPRNLDEVSCSRTGD